MKWPAILVLCSTTAHADDPRDIFGLHKKPPKPPIDCTDPLTFGCIDDPGAPIGIHGWLSAEYLLSLPVADATHDAVAHYATGAARDDTGIVFGGASGYENRWTIDGAPADNARVGSVDTRVPLTFLRGIHTIAGGFTARDRVSTGGIVDAQLLEGGKTHRIDARIWGSITGEPRRREIALGAYQLRRLYGEAGPDGTISLVASGPIGKSMWYAAGIAPSMGSTKLRWEANRLVDTDGDHLADRDGDLFVLDPIESDEHRATSFFVPVMSRLGYRKGPHSIALSLVGHVVHDERDLALATIQAARVTRHTTTVDGIATYEGKWPATTARVQLAWHHASRVETPTDDNANIPQRLTAYVPGTIDEDPALAAACVDADPTMFVQCPVPFGFFASGGAGLLVDQQHDRPTITADASHRIGEHTLRAGGTFEDTRVITSSSYTGGEIIRSIFDGHIERSRFHGGGTCGELFDTACDYLAASELNFRTRYTAAYLEDTFHPTPTLAADAGLRWELMWVGTAVHFSNEWSPRVGLSYKPNDWTRGWASLGRSFAYLPAGLGDTVLPGNRVVRDITIAQVGATRTLDSGAPLRVDPDLSPAVSDEATVGVELGFPGATHGMMYLAGKRLRAMETTLTTLTNPDDGYETANRQSITFGLELASTGKTSVRFGYLFTHAIGNTTGMGDPRQGAVLYSGADFDGDTANLFGRLPTDLAHRFFAEGRRTGHLFGLPVAASLRLAANSGRPRDALAFSGGEIAYLIPRGTYGRGPILMQANAEVFARWQGLDFTLDVFNVFDHREASSVDDVYTRSSVEPIVGGSASDLVFAKTESGQPLRRSTNFQYGTVFQSPIAATLGIRRSF